MVVFDFNQRTEWHATVPDKFCTVGKCDDTIGSTVKNHGAGSHSLGRSLILSGGAEQDEPLEQQPFHHCEKTDVIIIIASFYQQRSLQDVRESRSLSA